MGLQMSFHTISFSNEHYEYTQKRIPPHTLPVMYKNERVALAIFKDGNYGFNLPDSVGVEIDFGSLRPSFIFGRSGQGWSRVLNDDDDDVLYIVLENS